MSLETTLETTFAGAEWLIPDAKRTIGFLTNSGWKLENDENDMLHIIYDHPQCEYSYEIYFLHTDGNNDEVHSNILVRCIERQEDQILNVTQQTLSKKDWNLGNFYNHSVKVDMDERNAYDCMNATKGQKKGFLNTLRNRADQKTTIDQYSDEWEDALFETIRQEILKELLR